MYGYNDRIPDVPTHIHIVDTEERVDRAVAHLLKFDVLGFDVETYHKFDHRKPAFEPVDGARMRISQWATPQGRTFIFDHYKIDKRYLYRMFPNEFTLAVHNLKFELKYLMYELGIYDFGPLYCSYLAEQVISKGNSIDYKDPQYVRVGLAECMKRHRGIILPKDEQKGDWYLNELSERQYQYAARDPLCNLALMQEQTEILREQSQVHVGELEFACTPGLASMEVNGITLSQEKWLTLCDKTAKELDTAKHELWDMIGSQNTLFDDVAPINLNSKDAVKAGFVGLGINIPLDKDGKPSIRKDNINAIQHPAVQGYLKWVKLSKAMQSFGPNWVDYINLYTGRLHGSIKQIGAETGRMSMHKPNLMQMKKEDAYRNAFVAQEGWVFIDADYSQCELRILAELCRDKNLLDAFDHGYDLHRYSAHLIFQCLIEEVSKIQRGIAKNLNFGIVYGIGVAKFAAQSGIPLEEAEKIMKYFLTQAYPGLGSWLENQGRSVLYTMEAATMSGRIRKYYGDLNDREFKASVQRNAKNLPIQGTNADITKRAIALMYKELKGQQENIRMILPVHDEVILEAQPQYVEYAQDVLTRTMTQAEREYLHRVPCVVDCGISLEWAKEISEEQAERAGRLMALSV